MKTVIASALEEHRRVAESLITGAGGSGGMGAAIEECARRVIACYESGGKVLVMGNGGSAADSQHFAAELVGRYARERRALAAIALTTDTSALTAIANDYGYEDVFARQVEAHARSGDIVIGISTSGNSKNICRAFEAARRAGATTIAFGGGAGGRMRDLADLSLLVASQNTPRIQEAHITIIHIVCDLVEAAIAAQARS